MPEPAKIEPSRPRRTWDNLPVRLAQANRRLAAQLLHTSHDESISPPHPPSRPLDSEQASQLIVLNRQVDHLLTRIEDQLP